MLRARLATAAVAIPLLILLIAAAPQWLFAIVLALIAAVGVLEFCGMAFPTLRSVRFSGVAIGWLLAAATASGHMQWLGFGLVLALIGGLSVTLFTRADFERGIADLALMFFGAVYVGVLLPHFVWLRESVDGPGPYWVLFLLTVAMAGDTSGYFAGHAFGKHKLMPRVSPGKTVEGALGILVGSMAGAALAKAVLLPLVGLSAPDLGWSEAIAVALAIGVLGQVGDLCESMMKRTFATKESGWIFPGHGGVLDRIDSLVFPVSLLYYYVSLVR